jgi:ubiquinone/menaquinone biosynthesis C-methylase UbiE
MNNPRAGLGAGCIRMKARSLLIIGAIRSEPPMGQIEYGLYSILRRPAWFNAVQSMFVGRDTRSILVKDYVKPAPGDRLLDIGCGTGEMLPHLGHVAYTGVDPEANYIEAARSRHGTSATFIQAGVQDVPDSINGTIDVAIAIGVLHHLDDETARVLFATASRTLKPGGRLVTSDPVLRPQQNPIARMIIRLDRGQSTRSQEGYVDLARSSFRRIKAELRSGLLRVPSDHCILVCEKAPND